MPSPSQPESLESRPPLFTLIKGARLLTPEDAGPGDILLAGRVIAAMAPDIEAPAGLPVRVVDGRDHMVTPGFVDLHVHIAGGGGEGGPATRVPEILLKDIVEAGVTTVVGLIGTDDVSRTPAQLLTKALGLEQDGLNAYILSGSYAFPPVATITDSLKKDLMLIPHVVGVGELAISDHRSAQPTFEDLAKVAAEARVGGMLGHKAGLINLHMGDGRQGFEPIFRLLKETDIPISQLLPTHVTRTPDLFQQALKFAEMGGSIDLTVCPLGCGDDRPSLTAALDDFTRRGLPLNRITFTSDANGSLPRFDKAGNFLGMGVGHIDVLRQVVRNLIVDQGMPARDILSCVTRNPAERLKMAGRTGSLAPGLAGDIVLFDSNWNVRQVYCRGRLMVDQGRSVFRESIHL